jgi:hypothetical protein
MQMTVTRINFIVFSDIAQEADSTWGGTQNAEPLSLHHGAFLHPNLKGGFEELQRRIPQKAKILIAID